MKRIISLLLSLILVFTLCPPVFPAGETVTWTGGPNGYWHVPENWDSGQVPGAGDMAVIPSSTVVEVVYETAPVTIDCSGEVRVASGGHLYLSGTSYLRAEDPAYDNYGFLRGDGYITVTGNNSELRWSGGSGTFTVSADAYLSFNEGVYTFGGDFVNGGEVSIWNTASVSFEAGYRQESTGILVLKVWGSEPDQYTRLDIGGEAELGGYLEIDLLHEYDPKPGDAFEIMTWGSRTGEFIKILSSVDLVPVYTATGLTLIVNDDNSLVWEVGDPAGLENALNNFQSGDIIKLTKDIDYNKGIVIDGQSVIFDTNGFTLNVDNDTGTLEGVGLEVTNGGHVYLTGSGMFNIRQEGGNNSYGVKVTGGSTAMVTSVWATVYQDDAAVGVYAGGAGSSIHVLGDVHVTATAGYGAQTVGNGRITVDGTITAMNYIKIGTTDMAASSGVNDPQKPGYLKYSTEPETGIVWVKAPVTVPTAPQNFTAEPGDGQVTLSWDAPANDGGSAITKYQVSKDDGAGWTDAGLSTSYIFTGLTNGVEYTFLVRAVNSAGPGEAARVTATPAAPAPTTHIVNFYSNGSLFAKRILTGDFALEDDWPENPTRSGYSFGGWFTGQDGTGTLYTSATVITASVDLYAKWTYIGGSSGSGGSGGSGSSGGGGGSGGGDSSGSSTPATPAAPSYTAVVTTARGTEQALSVTVDLNRGITSIELDEAPWSMGPEGTAVISMPSIPGTGTYTVGIQVADLSTTGVLGSLTVETEIGSITVPSNMLAGVSGISEGKAEITIGQGDKDNLPETVKAAIGDRPLVQLTLSVDGKQTEWSNPNAPVTVSIPYTPTAEELANPESIVVWYIDGSGNVITIPNGHYDPATGMVTFSTTHFSNYAVAYNQVSFNDVAVDAWYHKAVSFIAAREITKGTGNGNFSPELKLTRGEFIVLIMRAYGIDPDTSPADNFSDAGNTYYTGYLAAAKRLGITAGVGNNLFAPGNQVTRQEMFTLLYNALKVTGQLPQGSSGKSLLDFSDASEIASWARTAMSHFVETGIAGGSGGKLNPTGTATRAEMAQVLYNLLVK